MTSILTWLHLSDLHMRREELDNLRVVLDALWRDVPKQIAALDAQLDFIAFTGDVAHSGGAEEYELAAEHFFSPLLQVTGLAPTQLSVVPGNHDVDWDLVELINPEISPSLTHSDNVTALLGDDDKRQLLFAPMTQYVKFLRSLFASGARDPILRDPPYCSSQSVPCGDQVVAVLGLNSAWHSGFVKNQKGQVLDRGNLLIGYKQVQDAIAAAGEATMAIALMHHPLDCLQEFDKKDVELWLQKECTFVLHGHLHTPGFAMRDALQGKTLIIPAGTLYKRRDFLNGYNLVRLDLDAGRGIIVMRRYSPDIGEWVKDVQSTGDPLDAIVEFDLPGELGPPEPRTTPGASVAIGALRQATPCWLRLGRERETQLLEDFLEQREKDTVWVGGEEGCGLSQFMRIARLVLESMDRHVIYCDAGDTAFGVTVDQQYFLNKIEHWAGIASPASAERRTEDTDEYWAHLLAQVESDLTASAGHLVLVVANYHLLPRDLREWVRNTLWDRRLLPLRERGAQAIFACEGPAPACPVQDEQTTISLGAFSVRDVERFLRRLSSLPEEEIRQVARKVHAGGSEAFFAPPARVYDNLAVEIIRRGWSDEHP